MGKKLDIDELSEFGKMIATRMDNIGWTMFELVHHEEVMSSPASMSRFLRLQRKPPSKMVEGIIRALGFSDEDADKLRRLAQAESPMKPRIGISSSSRIAHRRFADYDLSALMTLIQSLGWFCELNQEDHDYAYDIKIAEAEGVQSFVALNFPNPRRSKPETLRAGAGAMSGAHPGLEVTIYYEGVAGGLLAFQKTEPARVIAMVGGLEVITDAWLREASEGKGRIAHGGNLVQVLAEYLEPTDKVKAYIEAQSQ